MLEKRVWRVVIWSLVATGVLILIVSFDQGFVASFTGGGGIIPASTGGSAEIVVITSSPWSGPSGTDLYSFTGKGEPEKQRSFDQAAKCVTAVDDSLFLVFFDGSCAFVRDGKWERGLSGPRDFDVLDVAGWDGRVYAIGVTGGDQAVPMSGRKLAIAALTENGWQTCEPFDAGKTIFFAGSIGAAEGVMILYGAGPSSFIGRLDPEKVRWYEVVFDGKAWGDEQPIDVAKGFVPEIADYSGKSALILIPYGQKPGGEPLHLVLVADGATDNIASIPLPGDETVLSAYTVQFASAMHVMLVGAGTLWDVPLDSDLNAGDPRKLLAVSTGAKVRSYVYGGLLAILSVLLISFGITWLVIRIAAIRTRRDHV